MHITHHQQAVLTRIAISQEIDPECVSLGTKGAVFYRGGDDLRCLCQQGSHYWNEMEAQVIAAQAIEHAARK